MKKWYWLASVLFANPAVAQFDEAVEGLQVKDGLWTLYVAEHGGKVLAAVPSPDERGVSGEYIYASRLTTGLGSNPVGLDRGAGEFGQILRVQRNGARVFFVADNTGYRAQSDDADERRAADESFADSVIWATDVIEEGADGRLLIDLSSFLIRDQMGLAAQLKRTGQGSFSLDTNRSFVPATQLAFERNLELEAIVTFQSGDPGSEVWATAADGRSMTLTLHHTIAALPEPGFESRPADPRTAAIEVSYYDFGQPLDQPLLQRLARRFRLSADNPIVFYVDRGAPEPIRSALLEGAGWWADAFAAAGFPNGYRVELLPEDAHPLDIRYNVVQWVHRQTRGWSYGGGVADPRTGEMLKGHVILGSQRVRQDRMIFEGLVGRAGTGQGGDNDPLEVALARVRQLAAHEVGHALGFAHNMAASADDRASVMDYPAPRARLGADGNVDLTDAYAVGMGAWDVFTVRWLYGEQDASTRDALTRDTFESGLHFVADAHSRPVGGAHARGSLWDNGSDPVTELDEVMRVREKALNDFGVGSLDAGQPVSDLQTIFAPIYLYHRYQVVAASKLIGGYEFDYRLADRTDTAVTAVPDAQQRRALDAIARTLTPQALAVSDRVRGVMTPPLDAYEPIKGRERIDSRVGVVFDPVHAAGVAASHVLGALLHPQRLGRLSQQAGDRLQPADVLEASRQAIIGQVYRKGPEALAQRGATEALVAMLVELDRSATHDPAVSAAVRAELIALQDRLSQRRFAEIGALVQLASRIEDYLEDPSRASESLPERPNIPPGSPIGAQSCWHCDSATALIGAMD